MCHGLQTQRPYVHSFMGKLEAAGFTLYPIWNFERSLYKQNPQGKTPEWSEMVGPGSQSQRQVLRKMQELVQEGGKEVAVGVEVGLLRLKRWEQPRACESRALHMTSQGG